MVGYPSCRQRPSAYSILDGLFRHCRRPCCIFDGVGDLPHVLIPPRSVTRMVTRATDTASERFSTQVRLSPESSAAMGTENACRPRTGGLFQLGTQRFHSVRQLFPVHVLVGACDYVGTVAEDLHDDRFRHASLEQQ